VLFGMRRVPEKVMSRTRAEKEARWNDKSFDFCI
jgi:hypothetical protein